MTELPATRLSPTRLRSALVWFPAASLVCFYAYVIRARFTLGRWPVYDQPDPKQLGFETHYDMVVWLLIPLLLTGAAVLLAFVAALIFPRRRSWRRALRPALLSFGTAFAVMGIDPGGFLGWFLD